MENIVLHFNYLQEEKIKVMAHPPYSPDLAPSDFWLFNYLKRGLDTCPDATNDSSRYNGDYFNDRYRRDRYDLDNEPYEQHCRGIVFRNKDITTKLKQNIQIEGYINNAFSLSKTFPSPLFDRYEDEDNYYEPSDYGHFENNYRNFLF
ncbi:unnamed protein product [Adineta steineri]|uniref:Transposase n=1 Tax=Adineta steineri TaxID=433720 RepID=A0A815P091_9BILA|nr:unnamed protein product [Adineta steineri]